ncbi:hypothetical protein JJQ94_01505 [Pseudoalteromonas sp. GCY]|uniref:hypothetical protein n=1 Tax=Pseudoalteromonas sp. GCY TaxID=2003316 RepID=UPI0015569C9D|nr:hypothetical protein [Pseudoalteromonas sp. GCY]QQQ65296.1 hypothetical protein JJQ94_01505 [Pseudoalteromonas sp. GCY]
MWGKYNRCIVLCSEGHSNPSQPLFLFHDDEDQPIARHFEAFDEMFYDLQYHAFHMLP